MEEGRSITDIVIDFWRMLAEVGEGLLSTHSVKHPGYPFGSFAPFAVSAAGEIVFQMSPLAEHFRNLETSGKASLCVSQSATGMGRDRARATVLLDIEIVSSQDQELYRKVWEAHTTRDIPADVAATFRFMRGTIQVVRWIGGFGEARWLRPEQLGRPN